MTFVAVALVVILSFSIGWQTKVLVDTLRDK